MRRKLALIALVLFTSLAVACTDPVAPREFDPCCVPPNPSPELKLARRLVMPGSAVGARNGR